MDAHGWLCYLHEGSELTSTSCNAAAAPSSTLKTRRPNQRSRQPGMQNQTNNACCNAARASVLNEAAK